LNRESMTVEFQLRDVSITFLKRFINDMKAVSASMKAAGAGKNVWEATMLSTTSGFDRFKGQLDNCLVSLWSWVGGSYVGSNSQL